MTTWGVGSYLKAKMRIRLSKNSFLRRCRNANWPRQVNENYWALSGASTPHSGLNKYLLSIQINKWHLFKKNSFWHKISNLILPRQDTQPQPRQRPIQQRNTSVIDAICGRRGGQGQRRRKYMALLRTTWASQSAPTSLRLTEDD